MLQSPPKIRKNRFRSRRGELRLPVDVREPELREDDGLHVRVVCLGRKVIPIVTGSDSVPELDVEEEQSVLEPAVSR